MIGQINELRVFDIIYQEQKCVLRVGNNDDCL